MLSVLHADSQQSMRLRSMHLRDFCGHSCYRCLSRIERSEKMCTSFSPYRTLSDMFYEVGHETGDSKNHSQQAMILLEQNRPNIVSAKAAVVTTTFPESHPTGCRG